ncbi:MAG: DUF3581 domain-containing protein [Sedimenticola sp.]|nr:DUF3581 domain-containing protein [Sedimenticola sp.]
MVLDNYYNQDEKGIQFSREQASEFAKQIADDFNPLHDQDAKLFCVPGDLLFAVTLAKYGLSQRMCFTFSGMVSDGVSLNYLPQQHQDLSLLDENGKLYLGIERDGEISNDQSMVWDFTRRYVEFSGHNFLHVLVPMMEREGVMINPARPLVMYQSMSIDLQRLDIENPTLELIGTEAQLTGKKGDVRVRFCLKSGDKVVGEGEKRMALRGLRPYDKEAMDGLVDAYNGYKLKHTT